MPQDFFKDHPLTAFYAFYGALCVLVSAAEFFLPRRAPTQPRLSRWIPTFSIFILNTMFMQFLSTATTASLAYFTWKSGWGLLNQWQLPALPLFLLSLLLLDFQVYGLHWLYHKIPWGWRFHRVHHTDMDLDNTSGLRFHPLEALVSFLVRQPFILLIGPSPFAVYFFDGYHLLAALLTHANIRLTPFLDKVLRWVFVTPDMHRIHHSTDWDESNSNFGFSISWWDRLFKTYRSSPGLPQEKMALGLADYQSREQVGFGKLLLFPFFKKRK